MALWLQEAVHDKRVGLSEVHGPGNLADPLTKHVDHATQIRLLSLMGVEARMGRAETAPETGGVDGQVCSFEWTDEDFEEPESETTELDEKEIDWIDESIDNWCHETGIEFHEDANYWGHEIDTGPRTGDGCGWRRRPPAQAINTQCIEKREMRNEVIRSSGE